MGIGAHSQSPGVERKRKKERRKKKEERL